MVESEAEIVKNLASIIMPLVEYERKAREELAERKRVDLGPVKRWVEGDMTIPLLGDDPREPNRQ